ncbi:MAG: hypothetical protein HYW26_05540 [Candidatus Aenigmarchaeota archaeon]|nr:hypothetical protein [Candidatus Aenigmarchaeota archaeon]
MEQKEKDNIIKEIKKRAPHPSCPICGNKQFSLADGYHNKNLQDKLSGGIIFGGKAIPTVCAICSNCGYIAELAVGILGFLPKSEGNEDEKQK